MAMPGGAALARAYKSSAMGGLDVICRPDKAQPPPGIQAAPWLWPCPAALRLRGPTNPVQWVGLMSFVGRIRRSRHPAQKRLLIRGYCPAALRLRGPTNPVQWVGSMSFVGRIRRSRHPAYRRLPGCGHARRRYACAGLQIQCNGWA